VGSGHSLEHLGSPVTLLGLALCEPGRRANAPLVIALPRGLLSLLASRTSRLSGTRLRIAATPGRCTRQELEPRGCQLLGETAAAQLRPGLGIRHRPEQGRREAADDVRGSGSAGGRESVGRLGNEALAGGPFTLDGLHENPGFGALCALQVIECLDELLYAVRVLASNLVDRPDDRCRLPEPCDLGCLGGLAGFP
jgi:hypothetical protein